MLRTSQATSSYLAEHPRHRPRRRGDFVYSITCCRRGPVYERVRPARREFGHCSIGWLVPWWRNELLGVNRPFELVRVDGPCSLVLEHDQPESYPGSLLPESTLHDVLTQFHCRFTA